MSSPFVDLYGAADRYRGVLLGLDRAMTSEYKHPCVAVPCHMTVKIQDSHSLSQLGIKSKMYLSPDLELTNTLRAVLYSE